MSRLARVPHGPFGPHAATPCRTPLHERKNLSQSSHDVRRPRPPQGRRGPTIFFGRSSLALPCRCRWPPKKIRSEEHTSELQSLMRISYAVFCLKKKKILNTNKQ